MPAIEVSHVTKEYRLGALQSLKQNLMNTGARLLGRKVEEPPLFKALDDVGFTVEQGEVLGIIGHNGAGKSTLLKMLARISTPSSGSVKVNGRIAPLIEVGAGFVPDFTGRENVYLNGSIMGMSKKEIDRKFDEIVDFAEMAEFIDTPVKRYSSGMQVKLAFAVATSIEAEILIVDEVLAVGDLAFQRKCFDRMEYLIKREGRTVLLVSHNIRQVQRICSRTILLDHGRITADGDSKAVCDQFYRESDKKIRLAGSVFSEATKESVSKDTLVSVTGIEFLNPIDSKDNAFYSGSDVIVRILMNVRHKLKKPIFAVGLHTTDLLYLGTERSAGALNCSVLEPGQHFLDCRIRSLPLLPGIYSIRMSIVSGDPATDVFYQENMATLNVVPTIEYSQADMRGEGFVRLMVDWDVSSVSAERIPDVTVAT